MKKIVTYLRYFYDFIKHGEFTYFFYSIAWVLNKSTPKKSSHYTSDLGNFWVRKGTLDFQFANYAYEWEVKKFVYQHVNDYDVFIDIGANIGTYSILFANKGLSGIAFEPVKSNYQTLVKNIALNELNDQVRIYPLALGASKHTANFTLDPVNTGASHLNDAHINTEEIINPEYEDIEIETLDNLMDKINFPTEKKVIIKIDVEGMELEVLQGAVKFIERYPNILIVMESIHSGKEKLAHELQSICPFEIIPVDALNMAARKK